MIFRRQCLNLLCITCSLALILDQCSVGNAFTFPTNVKPTKVANNQETSTTLQAVYTNNQIPVDLTKSYVLSEEDVKPIIKLKKGEKKEKWLNSYAFLYMFASILTLPPWWLAMTITDAVCNKFPDLDPHRSFYDKTGKIWAKAFLAITNSTPTFSGDVSRLDESQELKPCLFVANHASWLDIPVLCTVLAPVFKFIAKGELMNVVCIGKQLRGGDHIIIDREDRRSQLRTFKEGISWLNKGVPLMAFPEGKRSDDGRLMSFKGGIFSMAVKAKVPIVPLSIANTHAVMPANSLMPFQAGEGKLHIHVHPPIDAEGKSEEELSELVRTALLSKMPLDQHPLVEENDMESQVYEITPEIIKAGMKDHVKNTKSVEVVAKSVVQKVEQ